MHTRLMVSMLVVAVAGTLAACTTEETDVETTPAVERAEAEADAQGEANIALQDTFPAFRATANPTGNTGPNAEAIVRGGASATTIHVDLDSGETGATYPWHIHSGNCGDAQPPIVGAAEAYPPIQVGSGGEGDAEATVDTTLDPEGDYILNVHLSPARLDSIVSCGELVQSSSPEY
ncbi:MAG TPA: hypothetical protein VJ982_11640 [Gemmatimonadota bacterium]|nr:hypothetical protein [Gemmatimonadota bacterium]